MLKHPTPFMLLGYPSIEGSQLHRGKVIRGISIAGTSELHVFFTDDTKMRILDDCRLCCESRYMTCDDDFDHYIGAEFIEAAVVDGPDIPAEYEQHNTQFLVVGTSLGTFTVTSHNQHNGYYGGFSVRILQEGVPYED